MDNEVLLELIDHTTTNQEQPSEPTICEVMEQVLFKQLLMENDLVILHCTVIIDEPIVVDHIVRIHGEGQGIIRFRGNGRLIFEYREQTLQLFDVLTSCLFNCQIEFDGSTNVEYPLIDVYGAGLEIVQCHAHSIMPRLFIRFQHSLSIRSSSIIGFQDILCFTGDYIDLSVHDNVITNTGITIDCKQQYEGTITIQNNKIKGGHKGIGISNCRSVKMIIENNTIKKNGIGIMLNNFHKGYIEIMNNKVSNCNGCAMVLEHIVCDSMIVDHNNLLSCQLGIRMNDIQVSASESILDVVVFRSNIVQNMISSGLIIREVACMSIEECKFMENVIGLDIQISTKLESFQLINPFIITVSNCLIQSNIVHGVFINAQMDNHPVYLLISACTFKSNQNVMSLSHLGDPVDGKSKFKLTLYSCLFEHNQNSQIISHPFQLTNKYTKTIKKSKDPNNHCVTF